MLIRENFSNSICWAVTNESNKATVMQIPRVLGHVLPYCLWKHIVKQDFSDIYLTTFSESVISEIQNLWGPSFFSKCSNFNLDLENGAKNGEKLFLLRTGYFLSAANVLTRSPKIWHLNKRDFFQLNWLSSGQWLW